MLDRDGVSEFSDVDADDEFEETNDENDEKTHLSGSGDLRAFQDGSHSDNISYAVGKNDACLQGEIEANRGP